MRRRFGSYLRRIRERRKLSLDAVEAMSAGYPEPLTKSHLSRIENGIAVPSFSRLFALGEIYGVPVASLAERFQAELRREMTPACLDGRTDADVLQEVRDLVRRGAYREALSLCSEALDRAAAALGESRDRAYAGLWLARIDCLAHLGCWESAKQEGEQLLNHELTVDQRRSALQLFVVCSYRLGRFAVASLAHEQLTRESEEAETTKRVRAHNASLGGNLYYAMGDSRRAAKLFREALRLHEAAGDLFESCRDRVNLATALTDLDDPAARGLACRALREAQAGGHRRLQALALGALAVLEYRRGRLRACETYVLRSNAIAHAHEYAAVLFRNTYYLWRIARRNGDAAAAEGHERVLRRTLPRVEGFLAEVRAYRRHLGGGGRVA